MEKDIGGWLMGFIKTVVVAILIATAFGSAARAEPWNWGAGPKPAYIEICNNNRPNRDRDRICSAYIQASFSQEALPDAALFLRERLIDLIGNYDDAAKDAFEGYQRLVIAALALAVLSAAWTWWKGVSTERLLVLSAISAVVLAALSAFGYNKQFKAHFTAARSLTVVKDNIEIALIAAAKDKQKIKESLIAESLDSYKEIVAKHVEDFGGAFTPPTSVLIN